MADLGHTVERLDYEWRALQRQRAMAADRWRDEVQRQFEQTYWAEYESAVPADVAQVAHLQQVIARALEEVP